VMTTGTPDNVVALPVGKPFILVPATNETALYVNGSFGSTDYVQYLEHPQSGVGIHVQEHTTGATTKISGAEIIMEDGQSTGVGTYAENGLEYAGDGVNTRNVGLGAASRAGSNKGDGVVIYGGNNTGTGDGGDVIISGGNATGGGDKGIVNIAPYTTSQILMGSTGCTLSIHDGTDTGASTHVLTSDGTNATWESSTGVGAQSLKDVITTAPIDNVVDVPAGNPIILRDSSVASNTPLTVTKLVASTTIPALHTQVASYTSAAIAIEDTSSGHTLTVSPYAFLKSGDTTDGFTFGGGQTNTVAPGSISVTGIWTSSTSKAGDLNLSAGSNTNGTSGDGGDLTIEAGEFAVSGNNGSISIGMNAPAEIEFGKGITIGGDTARPLATTTADTGQFWVNNSGAISLPYFTGDDGVDIDLTSGSGVGDVTSTTTIDANKIVIGADGAKGVKQAPLGSLSDAGALTAIATIDTTGVITAGTSLVSTTDLDVGTTAVIGSTLTMTAGNIVMSGGATVDGVDLGVKGVVWDDHAALVEEHIDWTLDYSATDVIHANNLASHTQQYTDMIGVPQFTILGKDTAGTGAADALTIGETQNLLNVEDGSTADQTAAEIEAIVSHDLLLAFDQAEHFTEASIDHTAITNIGTNTHTQIDTHIADANAPTVVAGNPHGVTLDTLGSGTYPQLKKAVPDAGELVATSQTNQLLSIIEKTVPTGNDWILIQDSVNNGWKKACLLYTSPSPRD